MAPLPENNTPRVKVTYQNAIAAHSVILRMVAESDLAALSAAFEDFVQALTASYHFSEVTGVSMAADGSDLFFDVVGSPLIGVTWGSGAAIVDTNAQFGNFVGRSSGGRRSKLYLFGWKDVISGYRLTATEDTDIGTAVAVLNANDAIFTAIDGLATQWKTYVNIKTNDHWVHESRNG